MAAGQVEGTAEREETNFAGTPFFRQQGQEGRLRGKTEREG